MNGLNITIFIVYLVNLLCIRKTLKLADGSHSYSENIVKGNDAIFYGSIIIDIFNQQS